MPTAICYVGVENVSLQTRQKYMYSLSFDKECLDKLEDAHLCQCGLVSSTFWYATTLQEADLVRG